MPGPRDYSEATKKALFALSLGRCYARDCPEQVMQMNGDVPVVTVQIAHIRAARPEGPRYDVTMTDDERRAFVNLILLCTYHHASVDGQETGTRYSVKELTAWKTGREGELAVELSPLTEDGLQDLLGENIRTIITEMKNELEEQIANVESTTGENARLLRILVKETFERPRLDADLVASLADSSRMLGHLRDIAPMLHDSSVRLLGLPDYAPMLNQASHNLQALPDYVSMLDRATRALDTLPDYAPMLRDATAELPQQADTLTRIIQNLENAVNDASGVLNNDIAVSAIKSASTELSTQSEILKESAVDLSEYLREPEPDRLAWFIRGAITTAIVLAVIGILVAVLVAKSSGS
jgi:hypothetical protein